MNYHYFPFLISQEKVRISLQVKFLPRTLSVDDVMKLVDTEEGDILVLTELVRDDSNVSNNSDDGSQVCGTSEQV